MIWFLTAVGLLLVASCGIYIAAGVVAAVIDAIRGRE